MSIDPVDDTQIMDGEHLTYASEAHSFEVQAHRHLFCRLVIAHRLWIGSKVASATVALHSLRAGAVHPCFHYIVVLPAVWAVGSLRLRLFWLCFFVHALFYSN